MPKERITYLLRKRLVNSITPAESIELDQLVAAADESLLNESLKTVWIEYQASNLLSADQSDEILAKILQPYKQVPALQPAYYQRRNWLRYAAAAVILFAVAGTAYFIISPKSKTTSVAAISYKGDIAPGKEGAKLKLADGRIIMIDTAKDGLIAIQGGIRVYKENGKIFYQGASTEMAFNEIITDKGRQWSATLPDGSVAWLNAASSLRYPLQFSGNERLVEMTGEASFKVVHDQAMPFRVKCGTQLIEDIGTEFNVKAYSDESYIETTLIEGSASLSANGKKVMLNAGQQAIMDPQVQDILVSKGDTDAAIAWRKGLFSFKDADIQTVMKEIGRWYDVEVKYEGHVPSVHDFSGKMGRSMTLMETLKALSSMQVHFRIEEDKRIVIMP